MSLLGGIAKDSVVEAHQALDGAIDTINKQTLPEAEQIAKHLEEYATYGITGIIGDIAARLNGAHIPVDITISATVHITGKLGDVTLTVPAYETLSQTPAVEVKG